MNWINIWFEQEIFPYFTKHYPQQTLEIRHENHLTYIGFNLEQAPEYFWGSGAAVDTDQFLFTVYSKHQGILDLLIFQNTLDETIISWITSSLDVFLNKKGEQGFICPRKYSDAHSRISRPIDVHLRGVGPSYQTAVRTLHRVCASFPRTIIRLRDDLSMWVSLPISYLYCTQFEIDPFTEGKLSLLEEKMRYTLDLDELPSLHACFIQMENELCDIIPSIPDLLTCPDQEKVNISAGNIIRYGKYPFIKNIRIRIGEQSLGYSACINGETVYSKTIEGIIQEVKSRWDMFYRSRRLATLFEK